MKKIIFGLSVLAIYIGFQQSAHACVTMQIIKDVRNGFKDAKNCQTFENGTETYYEGTCLTKKINSAIELREAIIELEIKQKYEAQLLKEQFKLTYESLKPGNIIKNSFKEIITAPDLKTNVVNAVMGFASGFIAKKAFVGKSHNPLTKLLGVALELVVANKVVLNAEGLKSMGNSILKKIIHPKTDSEKA